MNKFDTIYQENGNLFAPYGFKRKSIIYTEDKGEADVWVNSGDKLSLGLVETEGTQGFYFDCKMPSKNIYAKLGSATHPVDFATAKRFTTTVCGLSE